MAVLFQLCPWDLVSGCLAWPGCLGNRRHRVRGQAMASHGQHMPVSLPCSVTHPLILLSLLNRGGN